MNEFPIVLVSWLFFCGGHYNNTEMSTNFKHTIWWIFVYVYIWDYRSDQDIKHSNASEGSVTTCLPPHPWANTLPSPSAKDNHLASTSIDEGCLFLNYTEGIIHDVPFVPVFFHSTLCFWGSSMFLRVAVTSFFHCSVVFHYITHFISPFSCWWPFGLFPVWCYYNSSHLWIFAYKCLCAHMLSFLFSKYLFVEWLCHMIHIYIL